MPANLTPQYSKAEEAYRKAQTAQERVDCLEQMLTLIPKHKGTEKLQADLKTRLKEAREEVQVEKSAPKTAKSYRIPRQGAGTVIVIGAPNSGKSRVLQELTNAQPEVAPYPFTTREPLPGMMTWEDVHVQLIDTPPITEHHIEPYLTGFVRSADAALLCFDGSSDDAPEQTAAVIEQFHTRKTQLNVASGFDEDDLSIVHVRTLLVVTRSDDPDSATRLEFLRELTPVPFQIIEAELDREASVAALRRAVYDALDVIRAYTKKPGKPIEYADPYTIPRGGTVEDLALKVHRDLAAGLKYAKIWAPDGTVGHTVGRDHVLADRNLVELHA
jgi:ribosome-interacting GTPase 1